MNSEYGKLEIERGYHEWVIKVRVSAKHAVKALASSDLAIAHSWELAQDQMWCRSRPGAVNLTWATLVV